MNSNFSNIEIINFDKTEENAIINFYEIPEFNLKFFGESFMSNNFKRTNCESLDNSMNQELSLLENKNKKKNLSIFNNSLQNLEIIDNISFSYFKANTEPDNFSNTCIIKIEKDSKITNFPCEYSNCKKTYKSKENLKLHVKNIHLKEKPYSCSYCHKTFSHRNGNYII
jgi:hypothetical protein